MHIVRQMFDVIKAVVDIQKFRKKMTLTVIWSTKDVVCFRGNTFLKMDSIALHLLIQKKTKP